MTTLLDIAALKDEVTYAVCDVTSSEDLTCSRRREQTALQLITESQKAFQQASVVIGNHGRICDVVAGSIRVTLVMRTASDLQHLLAEVTSGCVQQRMLTWLIASNRMFSKNDVIRAEVKEDECSSAMRILQEHENSVQNAVRNVIDDANRVLTNPALNLPAIPMPKTPSNHGPSGDLTIQQPFQ